MRNRGAVDVADCLGMHEVEKGIALALVGRVLYEADAIRDFAAVYCARVTVIIDFKVEVGQTGAYLRVDIVGPGGVVDLAAVELAREGLGVEGELRSAGAGVDCLWACGVGNCSAVDGALIQKVEVGLAHAQACAARVVSSGVGIGRAVDFAVCGGGVPLEVVDAHADVGGPWSQSLREGLARAEVGALGLRESGYVDQDIDDHLS